MAPSKPLKKLQLKTFTCINDLAFAVFLMIGFYLLLPIAPVARDLLFMMGLLRNCFVSSVHFTAYKETFMKDMMSRIMGRLLADHVAIKRSDVVLLFKQFTVLQWIFENSSTLGRYLSDHYYEEFRYYIGSPKVVNKIPDCPLAQVLRDLISDVTSVAVTRN